MLSLACLKIFNYSLNFRACDGSVKIIYFFLVHAPMLGAYIFIIVISSSWIDPLIIMKCPSLSLFTAFVLKSILSDMSIATPAFFWSLIVWNIFPALHFQPVCVPCLEVGLL